jgi:uncharacterized membrane protein YebE (DUF533 family)
MPLPILATIGLGAGLIATYKHFSKNDDDIDKSIAMFSKGSEKELSFMIQLGITAAHADGSLSQDEKDVIKEQIKDYLDKWLEGADTAPFYQELKNSLKRPCSMVELRQR